MNYYKEAFQRFADFEGRSRRSAYWYFVLFNFLAAMAAAAIDALVGYPIFYIVYALAAFIPGLAVLVRRLHDTGRSGWWFWIVLVPIVGAIVLLVFLCTDSSPGENQYGPNPKEIGNDDIVSHLVD